MNVITEYLYGAYGSNLNKDQMSFRCPNAKAVTSYELKGHALKFRGVADVEEASQLLLCPTRAKELRSFY